VGTDYNEQFMTTVADAGRGNYAFLRQGSELQAFLTRELEESGATVAESLVAHVDLPSGVRFVSAQGGLASVVGAGVDIPIGTLFAGEHRKVVMQFEVTAGALGSTTNLGARVAYIARIPSANMRPQNLQGAVTARTVATEAEAIASIDDEVHPDALAVLIDARQQEAMVAWQNGQRDQALQIARDNRNRYDQASAARPSPIYRARRARVEDDLLVLDGLDAQSEEGRSYRLGSGATRHAEAASW
jgi:Ca-activated chloride channel family protein